MFANRSTTGAISMMHIYVLFYFVSNHFYNTHNLHPLAILIPAGLKKKLYYGRCQKCTARGGTGTPDKIYIIFTIFEEFIPLQLRVASSQKWSRQQLPSIESLLEDAQQSDESSANLKSGLNGSWQGQLVKPVVTKVGLTFCLWTER